MTNYDRPVHPRRGRKRSSRKLWIVFLVVAALAIFGLVQLVGLVLELFGGGEKTPAAVTEPTAPSVQQEAPAAPEKKPLNGVVPSTPGPHDYSVLVVKGEHKLYLLDKGEKVAVWGCAIGKGGAGQKQRSGDNMTPTGHFYIDESDDASTWTHDFGDGKGQIPHAYGPWFLSLDTKSVSHGQWDGIGIHGTHDPSSIGTNASEGCVRLKNENLLTLYKYVKVGTKVEITE